ncbi:MAG: methyltransferase, partial [Pseudobdellovibrio sp.]
MSSINPIYTISYEQPEEYRFSHDSVFLAQFVYEHYKNQLTESTRVLDLCAGCGIIGLDLLFHFYSNHKKAPQSVDFIEVQSVYEKYFSTNALSLTEKLQLKLPLNFLNLNYRDLVLSAGYKNKYDLILCNPPYFKKEQGRLSPSEFKNRCRFYIDSNFRELIQS